MPEEEEKPWEIVISSKKCPERTITYKLSRDIVTCKLSGGTCNYDNCPMKPGPED